MVRRVSRRLSILGALLAVAGLAYFQGYSDRDQDTWFGFVPSAIAKEQVKPKITPTGTLPDPNIYFPGTEALAEQLRALSARRKVHSAPDHQPP